MPERASTHTPYTQPQPAHGICAAVAGIGPTSLAHIHDAGRSSHPIPWSIHCLMYPSSTPSPGSLATSSALSLSSCFIACCQTSFARCSSLLAASRST